MADAVATVGVPVMMPVVVLIDKPVGKAGDIAYDAGAPPVLNGDNAVIAVLTV